MKWDFDPVIFSLKPTLPLEVRWYGLGYVVGFILAGYVGKKLIDDGLLKITKEKLDSLIMVMIIGMFLGARFFYVLIYNWDYYSDHLMESFAVWQGGLSFHGAVVGFFFAAVYFSRKNNLPLFQVTDAAVMGGCQGIIFGRLGNFMNGELWGRTTDVPWGMIFPGAGPYPRHPSQLYEAFFEGAVLFSILWFFRKRVPYYGYITAIFLAGYGLIRFGIEFFREADAQLGYYLGGTITMGQILCLIMVLFSFLFIYLARKPENKITLA